MKNKEKYLDDIYEKVKRCKCSRYYSWEHCYLFFKENNKNIIINNDLLNLACLNLAFFLASWGMYRGSSRLLQHDYEIHKYTIQELLKNCFCLSDSNCEWKDLKLAKNIIEDTYKKYNINPTQTLITKILMGMFGCTPAYDRFFILGLKKWNDCGNKYIPPSFNEISFNELKFLSKTLVSRNLLLKNVQYPPMKLIDTYFWNLGKNV